MLEDENEGQMTTDRRPAKCVRARSTWRYEEGRLTVYHLGKTIPLGRYATREHAAKAAAVYFGEHGGQQQ
jgi:hypothetical protein